MVSCDTENMGCQGGWIDVTWDYLYTTGIVTDSCFPYASGDGQERPCRTTCVNGETWTKYKCEKKPKQFTSVTQIKQAIYDDGPIEGAFTVY